MVGFVSEWEWLVKRGTGWHREKTRGCSLTARRPGRGKEALALHGRGALKVALIVFVDLIFALAVSFSLHFGDSWLLFAFSNCLWLPPLEKWPLAQTIVFQLRKNEKEADLRPITPSKIPVGAFRVEEEKAINRALNGGPTNGSMDSNRQSSERAISPAPPSRIPKFSSKLGANYKRVQVG